MQKGHRRTLLSALIFCLGLISRTTDSAGQAESFSATSEYRAILAELAQKAMRPSHLSAGELLQKSLPSVAVQAAETAQTLKLETAVWRLEIDKAHGRVALTNKRTGIEWQTAAVDSGKPGISWVMNVDAKTASSPLSLTEVRTVQRQQNRWTMTGRVEGQSEPVNLELAVLTPSLIRLSIEASKLGDKAGLSLNMTGPGPFFGLGERFGKVKLDGQKITQRPEDKLGTPGHDWSYLPAPFLFTPLGLGLYLDTAARSIVDLTLADQRRFTSQIDEASIDCYLFVGDPKQMLEDYTSLTGRTPLPPPWALGVWVNSTGGQGTARQDANRIRQQGIPVSALWTSDSLDDESNLGFGGTGWPVGYYGRPGNFNAQLHQLGFKVLGYTNPTVRSLLLPYNTPSSAFQEGVRNHYFVIQPDGQPAGSPFVPVPSGNIDFTNPDAVDWWEKMLRRTVMEFGFDGWMEDFGEQTRDDDRFVTGKSGREMANFYPLLYHKISYAIATKLKPDVVQFSRSGYSGSQGYNRVVWGGDQLADWSVDRGYPSVIAAGITAGLSGFGVWAPDILSSGSSKELWIRWTEFGAMSPVMRDHLWNKPKFAVDLRFDQETTDIFRRYARLHTSLFPYLYTYAHQTAQTGLPIMRHPMLEFPDDSKTYDAEYEYLLGEKLLVAPVVTEGARTRSLYLPHGDWVDYWTGKMLEGGRTVEVAAPLEHIPILVRAGSVIPLADPEIETLAADLAKDNYRTLDSSLRWRVFPASGVSHQSFVNYDGTTASVDQDAVAIQVTVEHSPVIRPYEVILPLDTPAREVILSGKPLGQLADADYRAHKQGWWLNPQEGTLHVLCLADNFTVNVTRR